MRCACARHARQSAEPGFLAAGTIAFDNGSRGRHHQQECFWITSFRTGSSRLPFRQLLTLQIYTLFLRKEHRKETGMTMHNFPQAVKNFSLQPYSKPRDIHELCQTHVAFCGAPMQHPHDARKILVVADAAGSSPFYYEFYAQDIECMEELPHITNLSGETINMVRVWIKKGCMAVRCIPFVVEQISSR
jgi:hypothetical protein